MRRMLDLNDHWFVDINTIASNAAISGSIFADPEACFVIMIALPSARPWRWPHAINP